MIFDLSHSVSSGMPPYPGDPKTELATFRSYRQDGYRLSRYEASLHTGTHLDLPSHLTSDCRTAADFPISCFEGTARVFTPADDLSSVEIGEIVLIATGWDTHFGKEDYFTAHPVISKKNARLLIEKKIKLLGIDTPSPDTPPFSVHKALLEAGIFLVENLCKLTELRQTAGTTPFSFYAVPLKLRAEASPVRAFAQINPSDIMATS